MESSRKYQLSCDRMPSSSQDASVCYQITLQNLKKPMLIPPFEIVVSENKRQKIVEDFGKLGNIKGNKTRGGNASLTKNKVEKLGQSIFKAFFKDERIRNKLTSLDTDYLEITTNDPEIPWELAFPNNLEGALGKRFAVSNKLQGNLDWLAENDVNENRTPDDYKRTGKEIKILFIVNPEPSLELQKEYGFTGHDINETKEEIDSIKWALRRENLISEESISTLQSNQATKGAIQYILGQKSFDILHYAGHSVYDANDSSKRGLVLHDGLLTPKDLSKTFGEKCPPIIFLNSCVSAVTKPGVNENSALAASLLEGFCRIGASTIIGTLWETQSRVAMDFSVSFYLKLLENKPAGFALKEAKAEIASSTDDISWASYVLYGDGEFKFPEQLSKDRPFRFLDRYTEEDHGLYHGREFYNERFFYALGRNPIVTITGLSGVGKSSFLRASILPKLRKEYFVSIVDVGKSDALDLIKKDVQKLIPTSDDSKQNSNSTLREIISERILHIKRPMALIFDQFERFIVDPSCEKERSEFIGEISDCIAERLQDKDLKFIFCLRSDYHAEFERYLSNENWMDQKPINLAFLDDSEAKTIIAEPFKEFGINIELDLVERIISDLKKTKEYAGQGDKNHIYPPYLQIVCDHLYDKALQNPKDNETKLSLDDYEAENSITLIEKHLNETLEELGAKEPLGREILKDLAHMEGMVLSSADLDDEWKQRIQGQGFSKSDFEWVLARLLKKRLVITVGEKYQLIHDCIANVITSNMNEEERKTKEIKDRFFKLFRFWKNDSEKNGRLLSLAELEGIDKRLEVLGLKTVDGTLVFLIRSAIWNNNQQLVSKIMQSNPAIDVGEVFQSVQDLLEDQDKGIALSTLSALGKIKGEESENFLIETISNTESVSFMEGGISSLIENSGVQGIFRLFEHLKHKEKHDRRFTILAFLEEDYRNRFIEGGKDICQQSIQFLKLSFLERKVLLNKKIWGLRRKRVWDNRAVLRGSAVLGTLGGLGMALIAGFFPIITHSGIPYHYYSLKGEMFANVKTYAECIMTGGFGGILIFPILKAIESFSDERSAFDRIGYGLGGGAIMGVFIGPYFMITMVGQLFGPDKEPFLNAWGAGFALTVIGVLMMAGLMSGLLFSRNSDGYRNPLRSSLLCATSIFSAVFLSWILIRIGHGSVFNDGVQIMQLQNGLNTSVLSYTNWNLFGEYGRFTIWVLGMSFIYIYFTNKEITKKKNHLNF